MKKFIKKNFFLAVLLTILISPALIFAGNNQAIAQNSLLENMESVREGSGFEGANETSVSSIAGTIVNITLGFLGIIFVCLIIYAGFTWMTAQGDESKVEKAKNIIKNCIIGLIVLTSAWAIYNIINQII
jgi:hypothetical protein